MHVIHHAEKIDRFVADIRLLNISYPARDPIDCFVGELFSQRTPARGEDRNQSPANLLVKESRAFAIRIKPAKQPFEILLPEFFKLFGGGHDACGYGPSFSSSPQREREQPRVSGLMKA